MEERIEFAGAVLQLQPKLQYIRRKKEGASAPAAENAAAKDTAAEGGTKDATAPAATTGVFCKP